MINGFSGFSKDAYGFDTQKEPAEKEFKLNDEDISRLKSDERYGEPRYYRADVAAYLLQKERANSNKVVMNLYFDIDGTLIMKNGSPAPSSQGIYREGHREA